MKYKVSYQIGQKARGELRFVYVKLNRGAQGFITEINSSAPRGVLLFFLRTSYGGRAVKF
jgi:hypothetical protein